MVAAADPLAVDAGAEMLQTVGSAIDAAIAVELTLGLVEPESSGLGGGGFLIHFTANNEAIDAYDGRGWTPAGARADMFLQDGKALPFEFAQASSAIADSIVAAAQSQPRAGALTVADLQAFEPRRLDPLCAPYRVYRVCTMPSPSSANAMLSILGLYERTRPQPDGPTNVQDWAAYVWGSRLSYADRDHHMADDRFVQTPTKELIAPAYLDSRATLINLSRGPATIPVGTPAGEAMQEHGTTHISVVDHAGNAVSLTATIESEYGSHRMAGGFWLNDQLTDFSFEPVIDGKPLANAVAPHKAPRSSMSPSTITDRDGRLVMVAGSMGGSTIIASVARTIIGVVDWKQTPQEAVGTAAIFARTPDISFERSRMPQAMADALRGLGWRMTPEDLYSGTHVIQLTPQGLLGGTDPREEGNALALLATQ